MARRMNRSMVSETAIPVFFSDGIRHGLYVCEFPESERTGIVDRMKNAVGSALRRVNRRLIESPKEVLTVVPSGQIEETGETFKIFLEMPDASKRRIRVQVEDGVLEVRGRTKRNRIFRGKRINEYWRGFSIPDQIDASAITAEYKGGVLNLTVPKPESLRSRIVEVSA